MISFIFFIIFYLTRYEFFEKLFAMVSFYGYLGRFLAHFQVSCGSSVGAL